MPAASAATANFSRSSNWVASGRSERSTWSKSPTFIVAGVSGYEVHISSSSRPQSRDPTSGRLRPSSTGYAAAADREGTVYGSLLSQGRQQESPSLTSFFIPRLDLVRGLVVAFAAAVEDQRHQA